GRVFRLEEHTRRIFDSAKSILLTIPMSAEEMIRATLETVKANGLRDGYIRTVVTRGTGPMGLSPYKCPKATVFIIATSIQLYTEAAYQNGLTMATVAT